jgi:hypothetical protein
MREDPMEMLELLGENFISHLERRIFPGGCFFAYTSAELGPRPGAIHAKVAETTAAWNDLFVELLTTAQRAGQIKPSEDVEQLSFELDSYLLLANFGFVMNGTPEPLDRGKRAFRERLDKARTKP